MRISTVGADAIVQIELSHKEALELREFIKGSEECEVAHELAEELGFLETMN